MTDEARDRACSLILLLLGHLLEPETALILPDPTFHVSSCQPPGAWTLHAYARSWWEDTLQGPCGRRLLQALSARLLLCSKLWETNLTSPPTLLTIFPAYLFVVKYT